MKKIYLLAKKEWQNYAYNPLGYIFAGLLLLVSNWLFMADIEQSTRLHQRMSSDELSILLGGWFSKSNQIISNHYGKMSKFLGDGFMAHWTCEHNAVKENVANAVKCFTTLQKNDQPKFRIVLHLGEVASGSSYLNMGEENLFGTEVNFIFRMERLASKLNHSCLISEPASRRIEGRIPMCDIGCHKLVGFDNAYRFFSMGSKQEC